MVCVRLFHTLLTKFYTMPLTKVTSSLINTVSASQITATGATAGQVLTYNGSTSTWVASAALSTGQSLLSSRGYQQFPNGATMQWLSGFATGASMTLNWAIPFTAVYSCTTTEIRSSNSTSTTNVALTATNTNVTVYNGDASRSFYVLGIGI